jgi:hypothetical protein
MVLDRVRIEIAACPLIGPTLVETRVSIRFADAVTRECQDRFAHLNLAREDDGREK